MTSGRGSGKSERHYISELKTIFEAQGPQLFNGLHSLCLTNHCLYHLQKRLTTLQDEASSKELADIERIIGCFAKVHSLKLITDRKFTVVPSLTNLDISAFKSLQSLTLKRIPINSLSGLQRVREQVRLLVVERCGVSDIEDLIVKCGCDEARPFVWTCLKELDLSNNLIKVIGEALQYLPELERVNLSSNFIGLQDLDASSSSQGDRDDCLLATDGIKFIDSVNWLHLGYNKLICVPKFGDRAVYNLKVLVLRNNSLRDIHGIEVLNSLKELDVSENLISYYHNLRPLQSLHSLTQLLLAGNPVCFESKYRLKTAQCLSHVVSVFVLDGKKLSTAEMKIIPRSLAQSSLMPKFTPSSSTSSLNLSNGVAQLNSSYISPRKETAKDHTSSLIDSGQDSITDTQSLGSTPSGKKHVHKTSSQKIPRLITFDDEEEQIVSTPYKYGEKIKQNQALRNQLQASWLSSSNVLLDSSKENQTDCSSKTSNAVKQSHALEPPQDTVKTSKKSSSAQNTVSHDSVNKTQAGVSSLAFDTGSSNNPTMVTSPDNQLNRSIPQIMSESQTGQQTESFTDRHGGSQEKPPESIPTLNGSTAPLIVLPAYSEPTAIPDDNDVDVVAITCNRKKSVSKKKKKKKSIQKTEEVLVEVDLREEDEEAVSSKSNEEQVVIDASNGEGVFDMEDQLEEQEHEEPKAIVTGEMFHVSVYDSASEDDCSVDPEVFLTISDRFIQEVTLNGDVQDQLDLQCLYSAKVKTRTFRNSKCRILVLQFNYERRDRRKREYLLADDRDEIKMMKILEPIVEQNTADVAIATKLECLKCQVVIDWSEALEDPMHPPQPLTSHSHHSQDHKLWSTHDKICPHCKERFLILQSEQSGSQKRSFPLNDFPNTPSFQNKPSKQSVGFDTMAAQESTELTSSQNPLSPGHMNIGMFDTYPDVHATDESNEEIKDHSSLLDMGPFGLLHEKESSAENDKEVLTKQQQSSRKEKQVTADDSSSTGTDSAVAPPLPILSDEGYGTSKPTSLSTGRLTNESPFSEGNDGGDWESEDRNSSPFSQKLIGQNASSKSSPVSHFKAKGVDSVEPESGFSSRRQAFTTGLKTSSPKIMKHRSSESSESPLGLASSPISVSVPSENAGFMSYFRKNSRGKTSSHSRTRSQDLQKVPPLPGGKLNRTTEFEGSQGEMGSQSSMGSTDRGLKSSDRNSSGDERKYSSGGGSSRFKFSVKSMIPRGNKSKSSSETEEGGRVPNYDLVLYRNNDPTYLHNNLVLHFSMNVFSEQEKFQLAIRAPMIQYGDWNEIETFFVTSNQRGYLYRVAGPEDLNVDSWLQLMCTLELKEVVYIEIGVCYQSLRLELDNPPRCYTFMIGIEDSCRKMYDRLSYIVSDVPGNLFKSIRVTQFALSHLIDPHEVLKEQLQEHYASEIVKSSIMESLSSQEKEEKLEVFVLAHKYNHCNKKVLVTLVLTNKSLYIGMQNPQWPFPALHLLPDKEDLLPPYSGVIKKDVTDVEMIILFDDNSLQMSIKFFNEGLSKSDESSWNLLLKCSKGMKKFIGCLKKSWSEQIQLEDLPIVKR